MHRDRIYEKWYSENNYLNNIMYKMKASKTRKVGGHVKLQVTAPNLQQENWLVHCLGGVQLYGCVVVFSLGNIFRMEVKLVESRE